MKKSICGLLLALLIAAVFAGSYIFSYDSLWAGSDPLIARDVARLDAQKVQKIEKPGDVEALKQAVVEARDKGLKVSIAGSKHSQGGHTFYQGAVVLDMKSFNKVLDLDVKNRIVRVQSGARWKEVQEYLNPHGLAISVMQSSYVFTVGGTLSANAHGRDMDRSSVVETVRSFRLLNANGEILNVSRTENSELFRLVIGGYGLFGVILDVDLDLVANEVYEQTSTVMDYRDFPRHFFEVIKKDPAVRMMLVRPSIDPDSFLRELVVTTWKRTSTHPADVYDLRQEAHVWRDKFFFGLSRDYAWAKKLRWTLQKKIESGMGETRVVSRTNAMRPPLAPLEFLDHYSGRDTDIIQEYYIPVRNFVPFMDQFREILVKNRMNVLSSTIRFVKANDETYMAYAPKEDAFAIIQMSNVGLSREEQDHARQTTQQLVDAALRHDGTYYLTYQLYPTKEQFDKAYPNAKSVFARKSAYDPAGMFMNKFYEKYAQ